MWVCCRAGCSSEKIGDGRDEEQVLALPEVGARVEKLQAQEEASQCERMACRRRRGASADDAVAEAARDERECNDERAEDDERDH